MTDQPSDWGSIEGQEPEESIIDHRIVPAPFVAKGDVAFKGETEVELANVDPEATIYFRLNNAAFKTYNAPIRITEATTLDVYAERDQSQSATITTRFYKIDPNRSITLDTEYANQYNGGGNNALIDGIYGTQDFRTGTWQGYYDTDLIATVDLGKVKWIERLKVSFLRDQRSWIFFPRDMEVHISNDGVNFSKIEERKFSSPTDTEEVKIENITFSDLGNARYIKIVAHKYGALPEWHLGHQHDGRSWLFVDEISIN